MGLLFTGNRLTTAILICGSHNEDLSPLVQDDHICMLPVLNRPLIEHTFEFLRERGIKNIVLSVPKGHPDLKRFVEGNRHYHSEFNVRLVEEEKPYGTAGALREVRRLLDDEVFLVISNHSYMSGFDFDSMLANHVSRRSAVTVAVARNRKYSSEGISVGEDGSVTGFSFIHPSREKRSPYRPLGIYIFNQAAFGFIKEEGYFDIKEQLIPALKQASLPVHIHESGGYCRPINNLEDYYEVQRELLLEGRFEREGLSEITEGVWAGDNSQVSQKAYIVGPVIIGRNCRIEEGAQVIGPAVIGDGCVVGRRTFVRESVLLAKCEVEEESTLRYSIVGNAIRIYSGDTFDKRIVIDNLKMGDLNLAQPRYKFRIAEAVALKLGGFKYNLSLGIKRAMDITASLALLTLLAPIMLAIAIAVKMDSKGLVIFRQKRCGKAGRDFTMLKFRTMIQDAHELQKKLAARNNVDGPMFKIYDDPRVTRTGKFLRKTSLDELPQLINVLMGEMSLVGPRPLVMDEMKFSPSWRNIRLKVKPGITGLWQVQGRSESSFHDWIKYDVYYVKNQSIYIDLMILFKTLLVVFKKVGAY